MKTFGSQSKIWLNIGRRSNVFKISRSANNLGSKTKSEKNDQSIPEDLVISESEYICYFSEINNSIWTDLIAFSVSFFVRTSISFKFETLYEIVRVIFYRYNFFCCWRQEIFVRVFSNSDFNRIYWDTMFWNWKDMIFIIL